MFLTIDEGERDHALVTICMIVNQLEFILIPNQRNRVRQVWSSGVSIQYLWLTWFPKIF